MSSIAFVYHTAVPVSSNGNIFGVSRIRHSLWADRMKIVVLVFSVAGPFAAAADPRRALMTFTSAERTNPSWPVITRTMRPTGHSPRLVLGMTTRTNISSTDSFRRGRNHFLLSIKFGMYCFNHRFQKWLVIDWASNHRFFVMPPNCSASLILRRGLAQPVRKWLGVSGSGSYRIDANVS